MLKITADLLKQYQANEKDIEVFNKLFPDGGDSLTVLDKFKTSNVNFAYWMVDNLPANEKYLVIDSEDVPRTIFYNGDILINFDVSSVILYSIYCSGKLIFTQDAILKNIHINAADIYTKNLLLINKCCIQSNRLLVSKFLEISDGVINVSSLDVRYDLTLEGQSCVNSSNEISCHALHMNDCSLLMGGLLNAYRVTMREQSKIVNSMTLVKTQIKLNHEAFITSKVNASTVFLDADSNVFNELNATVEQC